ncbi:AtpZ/AtpI family protein [Cellulosilyticum sp. I15G10I2]|uniref:AtpZ/AtpI family protein n=1 Tax=Cellulosilyticum sp. I15G10I2 TaxID=1892843 RepID=UPI0009F63189|nr:AtpZ/AtpI family protein [Cellulosilyticum sp. I15G10I2]
MKNSSWARSLMLVSQLGISMVTPILLCTLLGVFLDNKMNTEPWLTIVLIILGVGGAFRNLFYIVGKEIKKGGDK